MEVVPQGPSTPPQPSETVPTDELNDVPPQPEEPAVINEDVPMEPERTPTPPPPPFELNETALTELATDLRTKTDRLNIEQLEQLRATCLNHIRKHRTEWDRTPLVKELRDVVGEFVQDVSEYEQDNDDDS